MVTVNKLDEWGRSRYPVFVERTLKHIARANEEAREAWGIPFVGGELVKTVEKHVIKVNDVPSDTDVIKEIFEDNEWNRDLTQDIVASMLEFSHIDRSKLRRKVNHMYNYYREGGRQRTRVR